VWVFDEDKSMEQTSLNLNGNYLNPTVTQNYSHLFVFFEARNEKEEMDDDGS
jgi:hypothetical protein